MAISKIYGILIIIKIVLCQFDVYLPITSTSFIIESKVSLEKKQVYVDIDLTEAFFQVCCKPNKNIFQIIHSFLSNPFFQINQYICPSYQGNFKNSQINIPSLGVIQMSHNIIQYPQCSKGRIGLNKQSIFLGYLPVNDHTIKIEVNRKNSPSNNKIQLSFGKINSKLQNAWIFSSLHPTNWDIKVKSIQLGVLTIDINPNIVFVSSGPSIKIPTIFYEKIMLYYPSNQTCKIEGQKLLCLCESGIPAFFPKFYVILPNDQKLQIPPQLYMSIDSNICTMLFEPSTDNNWHFNVAFFQDTIFYLNRNEAQVAIQKKQISNNESSQLIHLPIPLILNCAVVLLLCIFASLVIIQIVKRISGLSELGEESLRQYIIQNNINTQ